MTLEELRMRLAVANSGILAILAEPESAPVWSRLDDIREHLQALIGDLPASMPGRDVRVALAAIDDETA